LSNLLSNLSVNEQQNELLRDDIVAVSWKLFWVRSHEFAKPLTAILATHVRKLRPRKEGSQWDQSRRCCRRGEVAFLPSTNGNWFESNTFMSSLRVNGKSLCIEMEGGKRETGRCEPHRFDDISPSYVASRVHHVNHNAIIESSV